MRLLTTFVTLFAFTACRSEGTTKYVPDRDDDGFNEEEDCDDNDPTVGAPTTYYADADADGHGDPDHGDAACSRPEGYAESGDDCDDAAATTYPGAAESCDGADNDCDGVIDNGVTTAIWYPDADNDGFGDSALGVEACAPPDGMIPEGTDCDDVDAAINPAAEELCDNLDNDCDSLVDDGQTVSTWYTDSDGDGYGDDATATVTCAPELGAVEQGGDCNDLDANYYPGAAEVCTDSNDYNCDGSVGYADNDGDSFAACEECNDGDAAVYPGADELCNGADDNCDGVVDENPIDPGAWYADLDGDGFGDLASVMDACDAPAGYVADATDCDDGRADINPAAAEVCDGFDNDCDALVDDADPSLDVTTGTTWYTDADGDTYGDDATAVVACSAPAGSVAIGGDCDDADVAYNPGAAETDCADTNDYNCDGSVGTVDADGDGFYACEECDDADATIFPSATEYCDGLDNDCDGTTDESDAADATLWYVDSDTDGYGDSATALTACSAPPGYVPDGTDCDDLESAINPAQIELCNGIDDDCDGGVDTGAADASTWYADSDGDTYGDPSTGTASCSAPAGYVLDDTDCHDGDATINPAATEVCDGLDNDCDGATDTGVGPTWYADADGDGYGDPRDTAVSCSAPASYVSGDTDCDDADSSVNPGATEVCDSVDNDCDSLVDEDGTSVTYYADIDSDGYGDATSTISACGVPAGYVVDDTDCDDSRADISPAATEVCDGLDNDCDALVDDADPGLDASTASVWYTDADGDGYGDATFPATACAAPAGTAALGGDCDDADAAYNPGASEADCTDPHDYNCDGSVGAIDADGDGYYACEECNDGDAAINPAGIEVCDGADNDCDGSVDGSDATDASTWYIDVDSDAFGDAATSEVACSVPFGYVADNTDCEDGNSSVNPAETEVCDGLDNDCDGVVDDGIAVGTYYADADADGYGDATVATSACSAPAGTVTDATDCDDADATVNPGATEVCDSVDNDCDAFVDEGVKTRYYADSDGDAYGDLSTTTASCSAVAGYVTDATDCDDADATVNPGATEVCDDVDNDCDGSTDEGFVTATWYDDADGDGYGDAATAYTTCDGAPLGYVADDTDCDDLDAAVSPAATETCDGIDNNCDGSIDEGGVCPCDVEEYDGHAYMYCTTGAAWSTASTNCEAYGYELVDVDDALENVWVTATTVIYGGGSWWTGLNDLSVEGTYVWSSGAAFSYSNWAPGQPGGKGPSDCVNLKASSGGWSDHKCTSTFAYVCEG